MTNRRAIVGLGAIALALMPLMASALTLQEAVERAIHTNPSIEAARANRRATTFELRQAQGRLLPQLSLDADVGAEKIDRPEGFAPAVNDTWRTRRQGGLTLRQVIFDGWDRANDIYKSAARVDAAAFRTLARSEALALDAVEAFIDVQRHLDVRALARRNVDRHRRILSDVRELERGGKAARSEVVQVEERLAGAEVAVTRVEQSLLEAKAKFLRVIGIDPPPRLARAQYPSGVPFTREQALALGLGHNPLVAAAEADADAARSAYDQSASPRLPQVALELRGATGHDLAGTPGPSEELLGRVVVSWNLFDGLITRNRRREFAERWGQALAERDDRLRLVAEELERALAARSTGATRVAALQRQAAKSREVVVAYQEEFRAAKRSLLDLLDSESARFNTDVQLNSGEAAQLFAGYRILAAMGRILLAMGISPPPEAIADQRRTTHEHGLFAVGLPPLR